jgi:uncharacterized protein YecA (UPF0149 family)
LFRDDFEDHGESDADIKRKLTVVKEGKIGRNEPCLYGSGKKYKHCCGK